MNRSSWLPQASSSVQFAVSFCPSLQTVQFHRGSGGRLSAPPGSWSGNDQSFSGNVVRRTVTFGSTGVERTTIQYVRPSEVAVPSETESFTVTVTFPPTVTFADESSPIVRFGATP